jgi:hypothetical protein
MGAKLDIRSKARIDENSGSRNPQRIRDFIKKLSSIH